MTNPPTPLRDLARQLLAIEAVNQGESQPLQHDAMRVCEKLRVSLTRFAGADAFFSLLRRALALAQAETPALQGIEVNSNGKLEGLEGLASAVGKLDDGLDGVAEASVVITSHLLALLVTFIGQHLTLRLVREAWPDATLVDSQ